LRELGNGKIDIVLSDLSLRTVTGWIRFSVTRLAPRCAIIVLSGLNDTMWRLVPCTGRAGLFDKGEVDGQLLRAHALCH